MISNGKYTTAVLPPNPPPGRCRAGVLSCGARLGAIHIRRLGTLHSFGNLKGDFVSLVEFVKAHILKLVGVKEKVFLLAIPFDEAVAAVHKTRDGSFLHRRKNYVR